MGVGVGGGQVCAKPITHTEASDGVPASRRRVPVVTAQQNHTFVCALVVSNGDVCTIHEGSVRGKEKLGGGVRWQPKLTQCNVTRASSIAIGGCPAATNR